LSHGLSKIKKNQWLKIKVAAIVHFIFLCKRLGVIFFKHGVFDDISLIVKNGEKGQAGVKIFLFLNVKNSLEQKINDNFGPTV
jgi:hypothetical protein